MGVSSDKSDSAHRPPTDYFGEFSSFSSENLNKFTQQRELMSNREPVPLAAFPYYDDNSHPAGMELGVEQRAT